MLTAAANSNAENLGSFSARLARAVENANLLFELGAQTVTLYLEIVARLEVEPEAVTGPEVASQPERGICGDGACAVDNLIDASRGHTDVFGEPILRNPQRLEEVEAARRCPRRGLDAT